MSNVNEKLNLLLLLEQVNIEDCNNCFKIWCKYRDGDFKCIIAYINKTSNEVEYYMDDCFDDSLKEEPIDMKQIQLLQKVIKELLR